LVDGIRDGDWEVLSGRCESYLGGGTGWDIFGGVRDGDSGQPTRPFEPFIFGGSCPMPECRLRRLSLDGYLKEGGAVAKESEGGGSVFDTEDERLLEGGVALGRELDNEDDERAPKRG
jgi:hypothetical protein